MKNWARCSPFSRLSGAGAGPRTGTARACDAQRLRDRSRVLHRSPDGVCALTIDVDQRDGGRIAHRAAELDLLVEERGVVLPAGVADAVVVRVERLHDRLARQSRRGRRVRRPASGAGRCAPRRGSPRGRDRRRPRSRRPASRAGSRAPWRSSACRPGCRSPAAKRASSAGDRAAAADGVAVDARDAAPAETSARSSASTRSVPKPICSRYGPAHLTHAFGSGDRVVAVVAARASGGLVDRQRHAAVRALERCRRTGGRRRRWRSRAGSAGRSPAPARRAARRARHAAVR